jgi:hypothetical protein
MSWMQRLKRAFAIDIETCPERRLSRHGGLRTAQEASPMCRSRVWRKPAGGRSCASCARGISASLHVIACIEDPPLIAKILAPVQRREYLTGNAPREPPADRQPLNLT